MLEIEDLKTNFNTYDGVVKALDGVNLSVKDGEFFGLVGETGSGKSVTCYSALKLLPKTGALLGFTAMASLGLPGLAGFWGEFMALLGAYNPLSGLNITVFRTSMVAGAIGTVLTAGYLLWMLQRVNLGEPKEEWIGQDLHDADNYELAAWIPLVILTVLIGVFPKLIFCSTNDAVINLVTKAFGG